MSDSTGSIRIYGDPVLRKKAEPVAEVDDDIRDLAEHMIDAMFDNVGLGLAAPQVGVSKRLIVIDTSFGEDEEHILVLINPELIETEGEISMQEGCLSVPGVFEELVRPEIITVGFVDTDGRKLKIKAEGMMSRVIQHEMDHLEGVLFVDRLSTVKRSLLANTLKSMAEDGIET
ncbi:peptide deformylase [Candidatus Latescibacterota bacterium]